MQISNTISQHIKELDGYFQNDTDKTQNASFKIDYENATDPLELSFADYKHLSTDDLHSMFLKGTEKYLEAASLKSKVEYTDDDRLNRVLFEKELESIRQDDDWSMMFSLALAVSGIPDMQIDTQRNFDPNNLEKLLSPVQKQNNRFWELIKDNRKTEVAEISKTETNTKSSKDILNYFKNVKDFFEKEMNKLNNQIYFEEERIFEIADEIVKKYTEQTKKDKTLLSNYMSYRHVRTKIEQTPKNQDIKIEDKEDENDLAKKLFEDIKSLLRTGLTVSELEIIESLKKQIQKMINEQKEKGIDKSKEINEQLEKLEKFITSILKRVNGTIITDPDDKKTSTTNSFQNKLNELSKMIESIKSSKEESYTPEELKKFEEEAV